MGDKITSESSLIKLPPEVSKMRNKEIDKDQILLTFCIIDDIIKAMGWKRDKQQKMRDSEVLTVACLSHQYFGGNYQATLSFLEATDQSLFPDLLSKSRFIRRLHRFLDVLPQILSILSEIKRKLSIRSLYFMDSFPLPVCEDIRIRRARLMRGKESRGDIASKRVYFYGIRVHIVTDEESFIHEFVIGSGGSHDLHGWANASFSFLKEGDRVICDRAYPCYEWEEEMGREGIFWMPIRRKGSRRYEGELRERGKKAVRRLVETVGSVLRLYLGKRVHAVTARGLLLKVMMAIIIYDLNCLFRLLF